MYTYLNQIVACVRRPGRYFTREIMVSANSAVVTRVEVIPEGYEQIMRARQNPNEGVLEGDIPLDVSRYQGCPYCGNREVFSCIPAWGGCGTLSCHSSDDHEHYCPGCDRVSGITRTHYVRASNSGFVDNPRLLPPPPQEHVRALTLRRSQPSESLDLTLFNSRFGDEMEKVFAKEQRQHERRPLLLEAPAYEEPEDNSPWSLFRRKK